MRHKKFSCEVEGVQQITEEEGLADYAEIDENGLFARGRNAPMTSMFVAFDGQ